LSFLYFLNIKQSVTAIYCDQQIDKRFHMSSIQTFSWSNCFYHVCLDVQTDWRTDGKTHRAIPQHVPS